MKKQLEAAAGNHEALKQFHYVFETYVNLLMWKVAHLNSQLWSIGMEGVSVLFVHLTFESKTDAAEIVIVIMITMLEVSCLFEMCITA